MSTQDVSYSCPECEFKLWRPIAKLASSTLGLYDDARFPGRCLLVFNSHVEELTALSSEDTLAFTEDTKTVARAIVAATGAARINYAILGNVEPHLHFHLIPRQPANEPVPDRSPWNHPDDATALAPDVRDRLIARIAAEIAGR